jgi:hypothetical protein
MLYEISVKHGRYIGHAHRHAGVPAVGSLDRIHGQSPDGIGKLSVIGLHPGSPSAPERAAQAGREMDERADCSMIRREAPLRSLRPTVNRTRPDFAATCNESLAPSV